MSPDVFFQGFRAGAAGTDGGAAMRAVLEPWVVHRAEELEFLQVEVGDGVADVYVSDDSMLSNHVTGTDPWDLLVRGARAAGWVVLPTGAPACLTEESQRDELPADLAPGAVLVTSGEDLLAVVLG